MFSGSRQDHSDALSDHLSHREEAGEWTVPRARSAFDPHQLAVRVHEMGTYRSNASPQGRQGLPKAAR
jgi:hypothetical protein